MPEIAERSRTKAPTLGSLADRIWQLKQDKKLANEVVDDIAAKITAIEEEIFEALDAQDSRKAEGRLASISINSSIVPTTTDWDKFISFVGAGKRGDKKAYLHLVEKRVAVPAYRELLTLGIDVPGQTPFNKRTLSVTTLK